MQLPKEISIILPLMTKIFSGYIKLGLIFGLSLHLNPYVLCAINIGSVDESVLFGNKLVSNAHVMVYSPAAIIRNAKIWNIILLVVFFRMLSSNVDLEYPAVSEENCLKNLLPLPLPLISWEFRHF